MTPQSYEKEKTIVESYFQSSADATLGLKAEAEEILSAARTMAEALKDGKKILFCGNGGSAADAQHLAAELVGRFQKEREPLNIKGFPICSYSFAMLFYSFLHYSIGFSH